MTTEQHYTSTDLTVGDRVLDGGRDGITYEVVAIDSDRMWCRSSLGSYWTFSTLIGVRIKPEFTVGKWYRLKTDRPDLPELIFVAYQMSDGDVVAVDHCRGLRKTFTFASLDDEAGNYVETEAP